MISYIVTDYKSIGASLEVMHRFSKTVEENDLKLYHWILIDNSSQKDLLNYLQEKNIPYKTQDIAIHKDVYQFVYKNLEITGIDANENGGYAKGNNLGAKVSKILFNDTYLLFSNNDLMFPDIFCTSHFLEIFQSDPAIAVIGPKIVMPNGSMQNPRRFRSFFQSMILNDFNYLWFHCYFNRWLSTKSEQKESEECDWVQGSFMFVKAQPFYEIDGFDEHTFLYAEEIILSTRLKRNGYKTWYDPNYRLVHDHQGAQSLEMAEINHASLKYYYQQYNHVHPAWLTLSDWTFRLAYKVYFLWQKIKNKGARQ
jgi:GT2 family glycosyltransferase